MMGSLLREWTERKADADDARGIVAGASRGVNRARASDFESRRPPNGVIRAWTHGQGLEPWDPPSKTQRVDAQESAAAG
jgi:hypothetical protein